MDGIISTAEKVALLPLEQMLNIVVIGVLFIVTIVVVTVYRRTTADSMVDVKTAENTQTQTVQSIKREDRQLDLLSEMLHQNKQMIEANSSTQHTSDETLRLLSTSVAVLTEAVASLGKMSHAIGEDVKTTLTETRTLKTMVTDLTTIHTANLSAIELRVGTVETRTQNLENILIELTKDSTHA